MRNTCVCLSAEVCNRVSRHTSSASWENRVIGDVVVQRLLAEFEPRTAAMRFDSAQVGAIRRSLRRSRGNEIFFSSGAKARWDFLEAARRHLCSLRDREELLVAFGTKGGPSRRARSYLTSFMRSVGTERQVALEPQLLCRLMDVAKSANEEALIIHNHPPHWMRGIASALGLWRPTPSDQDRALMTAFETARAAAWFTHAGCGRLRWYLVDEEEISEFRLPTWGTIGAVLQRLGWAAATPQSAPSSQ